MRERIDSLTGLSSREAFVERLSACIAARRPCEALFVAVFDIDHLRDINGVFGSAWGDRVLAKAAERLRHRLPPESELCRLSGDEFGAILHGGDRLSWTAVLQRALYALSAPYRIEDRPLYASTSVGVSLCPSDGNDPERLLRAAAVAKNLVKRRGRNGCGFFEDGMTEELRGTNAIEAQLARALERRELSLVFQPQVNLATGAISGAEALLRWRNPELGDVPPARFIPIAEEMGLIVPIGDWVLRRACLQSRRWQVPGVEPVRVAVNVSPLQLARPDFERSVRGALEATGLSPDRLELELTESAVMIESAGLLSRLRAVRDLGVSVALDDFGTGYSSLSYLRFLPFAKLKVDRSFVAQIPEVHEAAALLSGILDMARTLGKVALAEGVERREQAYFLRVRGCAEGQGNFYGPPLPAEEFGRLLALNATRARSGRTASAA